MGLTVGGCGSVGPGDTAPECVEGGLRCQDQVYQECRQGRWDLVMECVEPTPFCSESLGCFSCIAGTTFCDGDDLRVCGPDSFPGAVLATCDATPHGLCAGGRCTTPCDQAAASASYLGCDYWPTPLANSWLSLSFMQNFGVVVHNPHQEAAQVVVTRGEELLVDQTVGPGHLEVFTLLIETGLKLGGGSWSSYSVPHGAYHMTSTLPVAAYQFNPLDHDLSNAQYNMLSYTNDAALLLPTHVLTGRYLAVSRATSGVNDDGPGFDLVLSPGFVTVVGTAPDTQVSVTASCHVAAGLTGTLAPIQAMAPGEVQDFVIQPGEALQLLSEVPDPAHCDGGTYSTDDCNGWEYYTTCEYCDLGQDYDLTGTRIEASAPVAVFAGHNCSFVPYDTWACDHLEEQLFPLETWGQEFVVGVTEPQSPAGPEPNVIRVVSGADDNVVTLTPAPSGGSTVTLDAGQWVEVETTDHLFVSGSGPLLVSQFMVGQNYNTPDLDLDGDPAFALQVPLAQFRTDYAFLAPRTFPSSYVNIIKRVGEGGPTVTLDGEPVPESSYSAPVGGSPYGVARIPITGAAHHISATEPVGITVYGFARYTSYLYPGGLDLHHINPVL